MSRGLEKSSRTKEKLYKKTLMKNRTEVDITNYKNYRNLYNKTKRNMKIEYYTTKVNECKITIKNYGKLLMKY